MTATIAAKPTRYKGVTYRSRLEASWAVFFDECGFTHEYERFETKSGLSPRVQVFDEKVHQNMDMWIRNASTYRPDFRVDAGSNFWCFQEVKPELPNDDYRQMLRIVAFEIGVMGHVLVLSVGGFRGPVDGRDGPFVSHFPFVEFEHFTRFYGKTTKADRILSSAEAARSFRWDLYTE